MISAVTFSASNTSAELEYYGSTSGTNSVQTKESVDAAITAASSTQLGETYLFQNKAGNVGSTLDGSLLLQYSKSSEGIVSIIVKAENVTADITVGDIVGTLPAGYRPAYRKYPVFTLINTNQTITAECIVLDNGQVKFVSVGGASNKFFGQCVFSTNAE